MNQHLDVVQAVIMAVLQGITELFPVSSLGHAVVLPHLLGWQIDQEAPGFLPFLVALHLGTALALLIYFRTDWWCLLSSLWPQEDGPSTRENRYLLALIVIGTIPAGLLGLLLEKRLALLFGRYQFSAVFLVLNGGLLCAGEWLRRQRRVRGLDELRPLQAAAIGISQALALLPGFSRSGASMVGGLLVGLTHQAAARFSFLLATPIILAAGLLEIPKLFQPAARPELGPAVVGGAAAGIVAYASTAVLMRYFKQQEVYALVPFGVYCALLGLAALLLG
ncbi:MAG: undecaprenyl-diphosphate phosphatase [Chloroflexi bacterium]|nr:undecaprenyl-diphosphate phosphatase [Chloroflexota bacterium]